VSVLKVWNYNRTALEIDQDVLATLNTYGSREDLEAVLGGAQFDDNDNSLKSAQALVLNYFLEDRAIDENGERRDPINEGWEEQVFLETAESPPPGLAVDYFAGRSFADEFGSAISVSTVLQ
jgi:hypothetical protein